MTALSERLQFRPASLVGHHICIVGLHGFGKMPTRAQRVSRDLGAHRGTEVRAMRKSSFSAVPSYIVALALVVAATLLSYYFRPWVEEAVIFLPVFAAIVIG